MSTTTNQGSAQEQARMKSDWWWVARAQEATERDKNASQTHVGCRLTLPVLRAVAQLVDEAKEQQAVKDGR
jgi:hypothetical protein